MGLSRHPERGRSAEAEKNHQFRVGRSQLENEPQLSQEFHSVRSFPWWRGGCARRGWHPAAHPARFQMGKASGGLRAFSSGGFPKGRGAGS